MSAGNKVAGEARTFAGITADSREVRPGFLFAAIPGTKADGSAFVADAVTRGAAAVLGPPGIASAVAAQNVRFIAAGNPRAALAAYAAAFFGAQPATIAAVTGTNGKTSVAVFLREIWTALGKRAASLGTIGVVTPEGAVKLENTTPGPVELHKLLARLHGEGIGHLALEASSIGLEQFRLDGVEISAVAFTNFTRDHMDYHKTMEAYLDSKLRLFRDLARDSAAAVVNADADHAVSFIAAAAERGLKLITVGEYGGGLKLLSRRATENGQTLEILFAGKTYLVDLPLAGAFQASNALVAAGLAIGLGEADDGVFAALEHLQGAPGRLQKVALSRSGAPIYVDYAHTDDALANVLAALRPHTQNRLSVVFGCGGDRDKGKRPLMGAVAARLADTVIVTDDNPRSEVPAAIRAEILKGCPGASEIGDRAEAIHAAIAGLNAGDVLVIAGKGHESGQIVGTTVHPFSDRTVAIEAALSLGGKEYPA
jgi:UDP-N-acetylmuramoyl-L-alanyl-D-glutamate--2,6-diaminopimelate ligase